MTQEKNNIHNYYFYRDQNGIRRRYGIYAPAIDRFIHVSDQDLWMSLETAELLSSKIQTMLYVLPPGYVKNNEEIVSNVNCTEWGIKDKSELKLGTSNILYARQVPAIKMLFPEDILEHHDSVPVDFAENPSMLTQIKKYVDYVYLRVTSINIAIAYLNPYLSKKFISKYLDKGWAETTSNKNDVSNTAFGIEEEIKNILYKSNSQEEADALILNFWKNNYQDVGYILAGYYRILGIPIPSELVKYVTDLQYYNNHLSMGLV